MQEKHRIEVQEKHAKIASELSLQRVVNITVGALSDKQPNAQLDIVCLPEGSRVHCLWDHRDPPGRDCPDMRTRPGNTTEALRHLFQHDKPEFETLGGQLQAPPCRVKLCSLFCSNGDSGTAELYGEVGGGTT